MYVVNGEQIKQRIRLNPCGTPDERNTLRNNDYHSLHTTTTIVAQVKANKNVRETIVAQKSHD